MACFVIPMVEAIAVTVIRKHNSGAKNLPALEKMLWGGTIMLVIDHIINGELSWKFPFFTALGQTGGWEVMWHEMLTVGVPMAVVVTAVWAVWAALKSRRVQKPVTTN